MPQFKSGYVAVVGRPNVGKSTLINSIMGEKLSIISNKPQTTRNDIQAIYNRDDCQIIFVDTPGIHKPKNKLGEYMVKEAQNSLTECDAILFLVNPEENPVDSDIDIINSIKSINKPVFLIINKIDIESKEKIAKTIQEYSKLMDFKEVVPISALTGEYVKELVEIILKYLNAGPKYYPDDIITDREERFVITEIIREKLLNNLNQEVPHGTAVEVIAMKKDEDENRIDIDATIYCEKESHKAIIIGKNGSMIKKIKYFSKRDISKFLNSRVKLELWVKVKKDWRDDTNMIKTFGYK